MFLPFNYCLLLPPYYILYQIHDSEESNNNNNNNNNNPGLKNRNTGESQASRSLSLAVRTQCSQLFGHLMVFLRQLTESLQSFLKNNHYSIASLSLPSFSSSSPLSSSLVSSSTDDVYQSIMNEQDSLLSPSLRSLFKQYGGLEDMASYSSNRKRYTTSRSSSSSSSSSNHHHQGLQFDTNSQRTLSCVLFIGRLVWLLKLRGNFIKYALDSVQPAVTAPKSETGIKLVILT